MDGVSAAGSLLAIIGFTLQSTKTIYETTRSILDGPSTLKKLTDLAKELEIILEQLRVVVYDAQPPRHGAEENVWKSLEEHVVRCQVDVRHLEKTVADLVVSTAGHYVKKTWKRVKTA